MSFWIIKAKLHGLKDQTSLWLLKLYAEKLISFKPSGISIWQHPIPEEFPFTILRVSLHLERQPVINGASSRVPVRNALSVTANCHELVFGDRNRETGDLEP